MKETFINNNSLVSMNVGKYELIGEIDLIDDNNILYELKCAQDISLKYVLQLLMYNIMYKCDNNDNLNNMHDNYKLYFINFLRGKKVIIDLNLSDEDIQKILNIFVTNM
jgi:hypothetical protein